MFPQSVGVTRVSGFLVKTICCDSFAVTEAGGRSDTAYSQLSRTLTLTHTVELEGGTELAANLLPLERLLTWNVKPRVSKEFSVDLGQELSVTRALSPHAEHYLLTS